MSVITQLCIVWKKGFLSFVSDPQHNRLVGAPFLSLRDTHRATLACSHLCAAHELMGPLISLHCRGDEAEHCCGQPPASGNHCTFLCRLFHILVFLYPPLPMQSCPCVWGTAQAVPKALFLPCWQLLSSKLDFSAWWPWCFLPDVVI